MTISQERLMLPHCKTAYPTTTMRLGSNGDSESGCRFEQHKPVDKLRSGRMSINVVAPGFTAGELLNVIKQILNEGVAGHRPSERKRSTRNVRGRTDEVRGRRPFCFMRPGHAVNADKSSRR